VLFVLTDGSRSRVRLAAIKAISKAAGAKITVIEGWYCSVLAARAACVSSPEGAPNFSQGNAARNGPNSASPEGRF
jgi:hypothetical protein